MKRLLIAVLLLAGCSASAMDGPPPPRRRTPAETCKWLTVELELLKTAQPNCKARCASASKDYGYIPWCSDAGEAHERVCKKWWPETCSDKPLPEACSDPDPPTNC